MAIANLAAQRSSVTMGRHFDSGLIDGRAFDRGWLRAHAISDCRIEMPWGWRVEKAFPMGLMVFGIIAVTATMWYSLCSQ